MTTKRRHNPLLPLLQVLLGVGIAAVLIITFFAATAQTSERHEAILDARVAALNEGCADVLDDELERVSGEEIVSIDGELFKAEIDHADRDYVTVDGEVVCAAAEIKKEDRS